MKITQKTKWRITYDSEIPLLGIYSDKLSLKKIHAPLFAIAKTCKQPKGPPTDEWIRKMWYINTVEHYSAMKRTNDTICSNTDTTRNYHTE